MFRSYERYYFLTKASIPATNIKIPDKILKKLINTKLRIPPITKRIPIRPLFLLIIQLRTKVIMHVKITAAPSPPTPLV